MKKGLVKYLCIGSAVVIAAAVVVIAFGELSTVILNSMNRKYMEAFVAGERGVSSPWYEDGYHIVDESILSELPLMKNRDRNVVSIGSSLSVISFNRDDVKLPDGYEYSFLVCGNGSWKSDRQLYNLAVADDAIGSEDIVKLEMSYSTFRYSKKTITQTIVDKWGKYRFGDNESVEENSALLEPVYFLNKELVKIQNVWELGRSATIQLYKRFRGIDVGHRLIPGNFWNNYFAYDTVAESCRMDDEYKSYMKDTIELIRKDHTLIVELSPLPDGLAETEYGKELTDYYEEELIPYLESEGITYFDYRDSFEDSEFADGVHLGYKAGIEYTRRLNEDISKFIRR